MKKSTPKPPSSSSFDLTLKRLTKSAVRAAEVGGDILLSYFGKKLNIREKPDSGLVSQADLNAEKAIIKTLKKDFPSFDFLAEESFSGAPPKGTFDGRWVIDPLDGTTNFVHGFPMFCVSIAAEWQGKVRVGVILHPVLKELYVGIEGKGTTVNGRRCLVSKTPLVSDTLLTTGFTYRKNDRLKQEMAAFEALSRSARAVRRPGSAALDLAYTARGVFDGFWETGLAPWDVAAGTLMVTEAGGRVSDFSGKSMNLFSSQLLASNGILHEDLIRRVGVFRQKGR